MHPPLLSHYQYTSILISILLAAPLIQPSVANANGGIKEVAEGKYIVNLSAAPIAPYIGEKQSMIIGFTDIFGNLIQKDIGVDLTLKYNQEPVVERKNLLAKNGVLPFQHIYEKPGLYELFVAFRLPDEPAHTYMPEDFMIDVKERSSPQPTPLIAIAGSGLISLCIGFILGKRF